MNSKHKVIQWNKTLKPVEKEVPRHLPEMSRLSLMLTTATIVYENDMREDFRKEIWSVISLVVSHSNCFSFANLASLTKSLMCDH